MVMKKEYNSPTLEFVEFDSIVSCASKVYDGSETECSCTSYLGSDWTKI